MKKKTLCLCLLACIFQVINGSGDLGGCGQTLSTLPEEKVQQFFTKNRIVGNDKEQEQCSNIVFEFRKKMEVRIF